jgi:tripartite-type tricarboxylate transporter receptor subunit TctC
MTRYKALYLMVALTGSVLGARPAYSQADYPNKPIRMIVGLAAGGAVDITARRLAGRITEYLKVQVVVDNKAGANGVVAQEIVARAQPDGYTVVFNSGSVVQGYAVSKNIVYDPIRDFTPVVLYSRTPLTVVVNASNPARTIGDFIAYGKKNPDKLSYGTAGTGNITHLAGILFLKNVGMSATHVPYKGSGPGLVDLTGGQIDYTIASVTSISALVRDGRLRALALMNERRSPALPDLVTFREAGIPNMEVSSWVGILGPAKMPAERVNILNAAVRRALQDPQMVAALTQEGSEPLGSSPAEYAEFMSSELKRWTGIAHANRIVAE